MNLNTFNTQNLFRATTGLFDQFDIQLNSNSVHQQPIIALVNQILSAKKAYPETDTSELEREIDLLVYGLYGLTEEEIEIIENKQF